MLTLYGNNSFVFTACPDSAKWQKKMKKQKNPQLIVPHVVLFYFKWV